MFTVQRQLNMSTNSSSILGSSSILQGNIAFDSGGGGSKAVTRIKIGGGNLLGSEEKRAKEQIKKKREEFRIRYSSKHVKSIIYLN